jgi:primosomal protein N'
MIAVSMYLNISDRESSSSVDHVKTIMKKLCGDVQIIGPVSMSSTMKGFSHSFQVFLKDTGSQKINKCARQLSEVLKKQKVELRIDVDPVVF